MSTPDMPDPTSPLLKWLTILQWPLFIIVLWLFTSYMCQSYPTLTGKRILLLIAHPDDEAMFFAPTLRSLSEPSLGNLIFILCLSTGNAAGLGAVRQKELLASAKLLGITSPEHVVIVDDPQRFPDSMQANWDPKLIGSLLLRNFAPNAAKTARTAGPTALVDTIITFDKGGVSGHPNHTALFHGAQSFLKQLMQRHTGWECPVKLYTLTTTNVVRKYLSILDPACTIVTCIWRTKEKGPFPTPILNVSGIRGLRAAQQAMVTAHKSQMVWFRWGWIGVSRYMVINDLNKVKVL